MLLVGAARNRFLDAVLRSYGGGGFDLFYVLAKVDDQAKLVAGARRFVDPSDKYAEQVEKAIEALETIIARQDTELSSLPKPLEEFAVAVVRSILDYRWDRVAEVLTKNFGYLSQLIPFDNLQVREHEYAVLLLPTEKDLAELASYVGCPTGSVVEWIVREVHEKGTFITYVKRLVSSVVRLNLEKPAIVIGSTGIEVDYEEAGRLLIQLRMLGEYEKLVRRLYDDISRSLSALLGLDVKLDVVKLGFGRLSDIVVVRAKVPKEVVSTIFGSTKSGELELYVDASSGRALPYGVRLVCKIGDIEFATTEKDTVSCKTADCVARNMHTLIKDAQYVRVLDDAIYSLASGGFSDIRVEYKFTDSFAVKASRDGIQVLYKLPRGSNTGNVEVVVQLRTSPYRMLTYEDVHDVLQASGYSNLDVSFSSKAVRVKARNVAPSDISKMASDIAKIVKDVIEANKRFAKALDPVDATVLYILGQFNSKIYSVLAARAKMTKSIIETQMLRYARSVTDAPPSDVDKFVHVLHASGRLTIDDEGYLRLEGKRLVDVVGKYVGKVSIFEVDMDNYESSVLSSLAISYGSVVPLLRGRSIPDRVVKLLLNSSTVSYRFKRELVMHRDLWDNVSFGSKVAVLLSDPSLLNEVKENGWTWVLEDRYVIAGVRTKNMKPGEVTKVLVDEFPDLVGDRFDVLYAGGEPFIKVGNVVLQVREVGDREVVVQGTVGNSKVGMATKGKTATEAAKVIARSLVDAVIEFKEISEELAESAAPGVRVGRYATPLFNVPYITIEQPHVSVTLPLQPRFAERVGRYVKVDMSVHNDEEVITA